MRRPGPCSTPICAVDPAAGGSLEARLEDVLDKADDLEAQIAELQLTLTPEEQALVDSTGRSRSADHRHRRGPDSGPGRRRRRNRGGAPRGDESTSESGRRTSLDLEADKAELGAAPQTTLSIADQFRLSSLQNGLAQLGAEYEQLHLRLLGIIDSRTIDPVAFDDLTGTPGNPIINGLIGLLGGIALAMFGLVFITRATKPVWLPEDLEIAFLGEVPARRVGSGVGESWYDVTEGGARKPAIQALRSVVEAQLPSTGATSGRYRSQRPSSGCARPDHRPRRVHGQCRVVGAAG